MPVIKVLVALSGGVDSSVCVHLLQKQGYEVAGVVMKMSSCHDSTVEAARSVAEMLGIKLFELDLRIPFKEKVIDYFADEYQNGRTPNPCIICNPKVKFHYLLETANKYGFDKIATGHYASIIQENEIFYLNKGKSIERDQSYMLCRLKQDVLSMLILPLSEVEKPMVREIATELKLPCANAPDSQEICFVSDNDYAGYIESNFAKSTKGDFISPDGNVCGTHNGLIHYTVGQRKGLGVALGKPVFIRKIDVNENKIFLSFKLDLVSEIKLSNISETFPNAFIDGMKVEAKLRSVAKPVNAKLTLKDSFAILSFDEPQKQVSAGQGGALYQGTKLLGGGIIQY